MSQRKGPNEGAWLFVMRTAMLRLREKSRILLTVEANLANRRDLKVQYYSHF